MFNAALRFCIGPTRASRKLQTSRYMVCSSRAASQHSHKRLAAATASVGLHFPTNERECREPFSTTIVGMWRKRFPTLVVICQKMFPDTYLRCPCHGCVAQRKTQTQTLAFGETTRNAHNVFASNVTVIASVGFCPLLDKTHGREPTGTINLRHAKRNPRNCQEPFPQPLWHVEKSSRHLF